MDKVDPHSVEVMLATKTPEEIQKEAQQEGWLSIWHEWSWWFPWYRLHFIAKYNGETMIDVGIAALPFADSGSFPNTPLNQKINEWFGKVLLNVLQGVIATELALWLGSHLGPVYFVISLGVYIGYKVVNLFVINWNSLENLYVSLVSTFISTAISAWKGLCSFLPASLKALAASAESIKNAAFAFLCKLVMIPLNIFLLINTWDRIVALGGT
jgi:hypothetical protein